MRYAAEAHLFFFFFGLAVCRILELNLVILVALVEDIPGYVEFGIRGWIRPTQ